MVPAKLHHLEKTLNELIFIFFCAFFLYHLQAAYVCLHNMKIGQMVDYEVSRLLYQCIVKFTSH
jgi:hypothetical protein